MAFRSFSVVLVLLLLLFVCFLMLLLSSANVSHKCHKIVHGTKKDWLGSTTCRVWEVKAWGEQQQNLETVTSQSIFTLPQGKQKVQSC